MKLILGDCLIELRKLPENSVDSIVTDPPYELGFMGKSWDNTGIANNVAMWKECLRVLKPGGHLLAFSGTRTYHRMASAIEDAGFEVRDMVEWVYGSGFPKSLNIGKAVDKLQGNEREEVEGGQIASTLGSNTMDGGKANPNYKYTKGTSEWEGWGTALKPAHEPICMARKPLEEKSVAENVLKWGTGGINIDESRVAIDPSVDDPRLGGKGEWHIKREQSVGTVSLPPQTMGSSEIGRFPANLIHDDSEEVRECFPETKSGGGNKNSKNNQKISFLGTGFGGTGTKTDWEIDSGNASRFFKSIIYQSKAPRSERLLNGFDCAKMEVWKNKDESMEAAVSLTKAILDLLAKSLNTVESGGNITVTYPKDFISTIRTTIKKITELKTWNSLMLSPTKDFIVNVFSKKTDGGNPVGYAENSNELMTRIGIFQEKVGLATEDVKNAIYQSLLKISEKDAWQEAQSHHPTHKPIALMEYLITMVTRKGGTVLDPFMGSGSTGVACKNLGYQFIGMEKEKDYLKIAERRI